MILDEKCILAPPPPYLQVIAGSSNPPRRRSNLTFSSLPSHLLLQIVYCTFPLEDGEHDGDSRVVRQRENLHWLETSLRLVNRALYIACMHILRSTYLPAYDRLVRPPYSSDPFPTSSPDEIQSSTSLLFTHHRELVTLDRFISLLAHEDRLLDVSDLHLPREEAYKDLFDLVQPKSRLEDLIAEQGTRIGVIVLDRLRPKGHRSTSSEPIPFSTLSISFSPRSIGLVMNASVLRKKTLVVISRTRDEPLEVSAKRLVQSLQTWLEDD
ncbi:hypothetical protein IW261DRAFT_1331734 [Armillaria novae-zelandiae]|uniref:Uncharacterized protein n=1 Tax=Armillaria novae-zelandiae TaxID=153914 RepID=A0AA39PGM8_9AGAR|nr:hypothetical protein IW261DRAFT_1331734 [Armillaria novae-zelandiae]